MGKDWDNFGGKSRAYEADRIRHENANAERKGGKSKQPFSYSPSNALPSKAERDTFIAFLREVMTEALRVLKPGGHALIWALPRTSHWTATALEDAGFEVRDKLYHLFGSGFPKSLDVSKAIDKMQGAKREVIGVNEEFLAKKQKSRESVGEGWQRPWMDDPQAVFMKAAITAPATPEAQRWQGYGTALKPSCEEWILVRKPLAESSIAAQVLATGTGGLNIDACRVGATDKAKFPVGQSKATKAAYAQDEYSKNWKSTEDAHPSQRFPSHLLLSHSLWCVPRGTKRVRSQSRRGEPSTGQVTPMTGSAGNAYTPLHHSAVHYSDSEGMETVEAYDCAPDCPIAELDHMGGYTKSSGGGGYHPAGHDTRNGIYGKYGERNLPKNVGKGDEGHVSRYFTNFPPDDYTPFLYQSKASRAERNRGCENLPEVTRGVADGERVSNTLKGPTNMLRPDKATVSQNNHPTVKSTSLMRWLIRLITPPDGIVLDPFCGSGSTCVAAIQEGKHFIGIEQDESYVNIANARIAHALASLSQVSQEMPPISSKSGIGKVAYRGIAYPEVQEYECHESCPVRILGEQSVVSKSPDKPVRQGGHHRHDVCLNGHSREGYGVGYGDEGTAARYFQQFAPDLWTQDMQDAEEVFITEGGYEDGQGE